MQKHSLANRISDAMVVKALLEYKSNVYNTMAYWSHRCWVL